MGLTKYSVAELHMSIIYNDFDSLCRIVDTNSKTLDALWRGLTSVSLALQLNSYNILQYLVEHGANVNIRTSDDKMEPALFQACRLQSFEGVRILLCSSKLDINQRDFFNRTPLWAAAKYSSVDMVNLLLEHGADVSAASEISECPLCVALGRPRQKKIAQVLIRRGCNLNVSQNVPLELSLKFNDRETFCLLIRAGFSVAKWFSADILPFQWKEDVSFYNWIVSLTTKPYNLLHLCVYFVRKLLVFRNKNIRYCHVNQ
ncbi:Ankyrin repeat-containing protein, partial [Stegodyphus mimosarum]